MKISATIPTGITGILILTMIGIIAMAQEQVPQPPKAKKVPKITDIHGYKVIDEYAWLADKTKTDKDVLSYLKAEADYADAINKPMEGFRDKLYNEMLARIKETDENVPYKQGDYFYYTRTEKGKQYPIYCRKKGSLTANEEITLDINKMAEGQKFFSLGIMDVSFDGNLMMFATDTTGFRQYNLFVKDLRDGKISEKISERVTGTAWGGDNKTIFYTTEDQTTKRSDKFFRHSLGSNKHELLHEEKDELYNIGPANTRSQGYVVLVIDSSDTSEIRYLDAKKPDGNLNLLLARRDKHKYFLDHHGSEFYIRTNDKGKNYRLVTASVNDPSVTNWKEIVPHRSNIMLSNIECFANHYVLVARENGLPVIGVTEIKTGKSHYVQFPEPVYDASASQNAEFNTSTFRFVYESMVTPMSVFDYDLNTKEQKLMKRQPVLGGYDQNLYKSERIFATASDGTKIPMSIVYKKDMKKDGNRPMLLRGYGSYGLSNDVSFSSNIISLLDRGVIFGIAHIRGGGELGKEWHDQGKMMVKKNTFTDFITCSEFVISEKYTSKDRLIITGGSAGGLLMGAVSNMRPDLFKAVFTYVPFVDVMNTMLDDSLPLTIGEYLEWGNPNEKPAYDYMNSYSPYDNVARKNYPTMFVRTSLNDSQVMYWEPAKYVAKLRDMKTDNNLLIFKIKLEPGGHGGASGRYDRLKDQAYDWAFMLNQVGITK